MTVHIPSNSLSTPRAKKFRENMIKHGFKRVQKWVFDLENTAVQKQMQKDLSHFRATKDMLEWDEFATVQMAHIEGWD